MRTVKEKIFIFLIDALRYDYITTNYMPFICSLKKNGNFSKLEPTLGYEGRPVFFAGMYPEESNIAFRYIYDPQNSPFKRISFFKKNKKIKNLYLKYLRKKNKNNFYRNIIAQREIPDEFLKFLSFSEKNAFWESGYLENTKTMFEVFIDSGYTIKLNTWPYSEYGIDSQGAVKFFENTDLQNDLYYIHIGDIDWAQHRFGPDSDTVALQRRLVDTTLEFIFKKFILPQEKFHLFIFGDHGASEVNNTYDIRKDLEQLKLKLKKDYLYFIDSAITRFWIFNNKARRIITDFLSDQKSQGILLDKRLLEEFKFNFKNNKNGDLFFLANEGTIFFPNFHSSKIPDKGMHGYDPRLKNEQTCLLYYSNFQNIKLAEEGELIQLSPTILSILDLNIPTSYRIDSLIVS